MTNAYWDYIDPTIGGLIVIINLVELIVMFKMKKKLESSMILIMNLSISDLLAGIMILACKFLRDDLNKKKLVIEKMGKGDLILVEMYYFCNFGFLRLSLVNSVLNLIVITIDRLIAVGKPMFYRKIRQRHAISVCALVWVLSISAILIYYFCLKYINVESSLLRYDLLIFPLLTIPTLFGLFLSYAKIIRILQLLRKELSTRRQDSGGPKQQNDQSLHIRRELKVIKLAIAVLSVYFLCWTPLAIYGIVRAFDIESKKVQDITFAIALLNSVFDPIVYFHYARREIYKLSRTVINYFKSSQKKEDATKNILQTVADKEDKTKCKNSIETTIC